MSNLKNAAERLRNSMYPEYRYSIEDKLEYIQESVLAIMEHLIETQEKGEE